MDSLAHPEYYFQKRKIPPRDSVPANIERLKALAQPSERHRRKKFKPTSPKRDHRLPELEGDALELYMSLSKPKTVREKYKAPAPREYKHYQPLREDVCETFISMAVPSPRIKRAKYKKPPPPTFRKLRKRVPDEQKWIELMNKK